ncbi:hypothetical protein E2320_007949, partial [Naja naja]
KHIFYLYFIICICIYILQVPEIISTIRQAGKISRQEDFQSQPEDPFSKKFEVLFCGRVTVAHKNAPPALIDECIEKFNDVSDTKNLDLPRQNDSADHSSGFSLSDKFRSVFQSSASEEEATKPLRKSYSQPGLPSFALKKDVQSWSLKGNSLARSLDEDDVVSLNLKSQFIQGQNVQPTDIAGNRIMLFTIGQSEVYIISPETKKVVIEKSFKEISFCSQVDEIMMTLKQAFSVAAIQQNFKAQLPFCDVCPMQILHKLCEKIEGMHPSKTKLELQKHLTALNNQEQAWIFEEVQTGQSSGEAVGNEMPNSTSRFNLDVLKSKAKRSLTESLENILSRGNKSKSLQDTAGSIDLDSSLSSTLSTIRPSEEHPAPSAYQGFRRRANTLSHVPLETQESFESVETSPSVSQRKLLRYHSMTTEAPDQQKHNKSNEADLVPETPVKARRHSWRQQIFLRIIPNWENWPLDHRYSQFVKTDHLEEPKKTEKRHPRTSENDLLNKRLKLDYEEMTPCLKEVLSIWDKMLTTPGRSKIKLDMEKIYSAEFLGNNGERFGKLHQLKHPFSNKQQPKDTPYKELLKQLTSQQHAILIDLGRTFPTHPYFSSQLGAGQLSLYNILKAYSLLDQEVGYCQGLSFVAGVLLLHMSEEEAFKMLKFLMFELGLRKQYRPDMTILQIQMYQLSRLLHDYHKDLYDHFEANEISPSLYAAPWFLTLFASQFPLGFVARVFDLMFLQGPEVLFKVALSLLGSHKPLILQHENLETIVDFIKNILPNLGLVQMEKTINQVFEMDISKQLQAYEVEYHVLQDELIDSSLNDNQRMDKLEKANSNLRKQNFDLLEELQVASGKIQNLEAMVEVLLNSEGKLKQTIRALELERKALLENLKEFHMQPANSSGKTLRSEQGRTNAAD